LFFIAKPNILDYTKRGSKMFDFTVAHGFGNVLDDKPERLEPSGNLFNGEAIREFDIGGVNYGKGNLAPWCIFGEW